MTDVEPMIRAHGPFQVSAVPESSTQSLRPEIRLMLAVLEHAVEDFRTYAFVTTGRARFLFLEASAWFCSTATGPFDFEGICEATGLEPDCIRTSLRRWYHSTACRAESASDLDRPWAARADRSANRAVHGGCRQPPPSGPPRSGDARRRCVSTPAGLG